MQKHRQLDRQTLLAAADFPRCLRHASVRLSLCHSDSDLSMNAVIDPFSFHPELRDKIEDPLESYFRTFDIESVLERRPELAWLREMIHTAAQRDENRLNLLRDLPAEDIWVFAYGSLMWNPAFIFSEVRRAHVPDYERRFILKDTMGARGFPENPGLMAALDVGTGCDGLLFRIPHEIIETETEILWRREFVAPTYLPQFVTATFGDTTVQALTFVADHNADQIVGDISRDEQVRYLTMGEGLMGTSLAYLANIVSQFEALGIVDDECAFLLAAANEKMAAS